MNAARDLRRAVEHAIRVFALVSDADAALRPAPGKWSKKEIVGHLIDSASNNHQRFVRANFQDDLVFDGYDQDRWVAVQRYQERPWSELVELFRALNLHLAHVIESTAPAVLERAHTRHNLDLRAFRPVEERAPVTLAWFMEDYVLHLEHHLAAAGVR